MKPPAARIYALVTLLWVASCASGSLFNSPDGNAPTGGDGGGGDGGLVGALTINPTSLTIITSGEAERATYTVTAANLGDITARVTATLDDSSLATVTPGVVSVPANAPRGGRATLTISYGGQTATAPLLVRLQAADSLDNGAPNPPSLFFGSNMTGAKPAWVYPFTSAVVPHNMNALNFQFNAPSGTVATLININCPTYSQNFYNGLSICQTSSNPYTCAYTPPASKYAIFVASCSGEDITLTVTASTGQGVPVGSDAPRTIHMTHDALSGAVYYGTEGPFDGLMRTTLDSPQAQVFSSTCGGCHRAATNGLSVAVVEGYGAPGGILSGKNGASAVLPPGIYGDWNFPSFPLSGSEVMTVYLGTLTVLNAKTGQQIATVSGSSNPLIQGVISFPEVSPDGTRVVFSRAGAAATDSDYQRTDTGDLMIMPFDGANFGTPVRLLALSSGVYHMYPSFTPDGQYILYNTAEAPCGNGILPPNCISINARNTFLRIISATPQAKPVAVDLTLAWQRAGLGSNLPRAAPALVDGKYLFFSFHSHLPYGFLSDGNSSQVYLATVDMSKLAQAMSGSGGDPSSAPVWLPQQNPAANNFMPTWSTIAACSANTDCPNTLICQNGSCVASLD